MSEKLIYSAIKLVRRTRNLQNKISDKAQNLLKKKTIWENHRLPERQLLLGRKQKIVNLQNNEGHLANNKDNILAIIKSYYKPTIIPKDLFESKICLRK